MGKPVMLCVTLGNDIVWRYAKCADFKSLHNDKLSEVKLKVHWFSDESFRACDNIYIDYFYDNKYYRRALTYTESQPPYWVFNKDDKAYILLDDRVTTVSFKDTVNIKVITSVQKPEYLQRAHHFNVQEKNSMNHRILPLLEKEEENRAVLKFMIQLNNKLDDILFILNNKGDDTDLTSFQAIGINVRELIFFSHDQIKNEFGYFTALLGEHSDRFHFASVIKIELLSNSPDGYLYKGIFQDLQWEIEDRIIKFIFSKEREMLNEVRDL